MGQHTAAQGTPQLKLAGLLSRHLEYLADLQAVGRAFDWDLRCAGQLAAIQAGPEPGGSLAGS